VIDAPIFFIPICPLCPPQCPSALHSGSYLRVKEKVVILRNATGCNFNGRKITRQPWEWVGRRQRCGINEKGDKFYDFIC
jgi:hypothetical protein